MIGIRIELIDKLHLKVELTDTDMQTLEINRSSFVSQTEQAKTVLKLILKNAYEQTGFEIFNVKLLVEIFPTFGDGCLIMFTKKPDKLKRFRVTSPRNSVIFEFSDINNLFDCADLLNQQGGCGENSLFYINKKYYFCFRPDFCKIKALFLILSEFGARRVDFPKSFLHEHGNCLIKTDALKMLCRNKNR